MAPEITVVTLTRSRPAQLKRAIRSLWLQRDVHIDLVLLVDDCEETRIFLEDFVLEQDAVKRCRVIFAHRSSGERSGPRRVAKLRNASLGTIETPLCALLDDDNSFESDHLSALLEQVNDTTRVVHSWRSLWNIDDTPFCLAGLHPWSRELATSRQLYRQYSDAGIYQLGTNIIRDRVIPYDRRQSMVDMSEWLFATDFLSRLKFVELFDSEDMLTSRTEDSKLLDAIVEMGIVVPCTRRPSLRYYLGGYSNHWESEAASPSAWYAT